MASSCNVEETAVTANWGQENVQSWSIGLIYCSNYYHLLCMARSANDKICLLQIPYINIPMPFASACGIFAMK